MEFVIRKTKVRGRTRTVPDPAHLKRLRKACKLSLTRVGWLAGCSARYIAMVESGEEPCSQRILTAYYELEARLERQRWLEPVEV